MKLYFLNDEIKFPSVEDASEEGIVAIGGDLAPERLLLAYKKGIFPWFSIEEPIIWWSPDPRMVLFPDRLKISKSMKKLLKNDAFEVTYNTAFRDVILNCATIHREGQDETWITNTMIQAYCKLHDLGIATSVEVWKDKTLVGGLYGIDLGTVFCGESMFSKVSNASKYGFIKFVKTLQEKKYKLIDCQVHTSHLESLGAEEISREVFLSYLPYED